MINKKKLAGIVLAGVLTVAGTTSAFAADVTADVKAPFHRQLFKIDKTEISAKIKSAIDSLVSAGTITQAQADAVSKAFTPGEGKGIPEEKLQFRLRSPMDALVASGTITQAQADAINTALKAGFEDKKAPADVLKELVSAGTITQAQAEAASKCFTQRKFDDRIVMHNPMSELVAAGSITQAQADEVAKAIRTGMMENKTMDEIFNNLVKAGTITEAQKDAVQKAFPIKPERPFDKDHINKGAFMKHGKNPLDELVSAGTITQAQADAINQAVKATLKPSEK